MAWKKYSSRYRDDLYKLLEEKEYEALSFCSRFISRPIIQLTDKKDFIYIYQDSRGNLTAAVMLTKNGQLLPVKKADSELAENCFPELISLLGSKIYHINSVMGENDLIDSLYISLGQAVKPIKTTDYVYYIMIIKNKKLFTPPDLQKLKNQFSIRKPETADIPDLMPLQELYEKEEVLPSELLYDPNTSMRYIVNSIKHQISVICEDSNKKIVSKANTNASGINCSQIGGVYTLPEFRNRGIGKYVTGELVKNIFSAGKRPSLFVKKNNLPAVSVYKKLGFKITSSFKIIYFF